MYKNNNLTGKNSYTNPSLVVKPNIKPPEKEHPSTNRGLHNCNEGRFEQPYRGSTDNYTTIIKKDPITGLFFAPNYSSSFANIISRLDYLGKSKLDATAIRDIDGLVFDKDYVHTDNNFTDAYKDKIDNFDVSSLEEIAILDAKVDGLTNTVNSNTSKISENTSGISSLGAQVTTLKNGVDYLTVFTDGLEEELSSHYESIEGLKTTVNTLTNTANSAHSIASILRGQDENKSARTIASEEVAKIVAGADTSFDTLKEIADWISKHPESVAALNTKIESNTANINKNIVKLDELTQDYTGFKDLVVLLNEPQTISGGKTFVNDTTFIGNTTLPTPTSAFTNFGGTHLKNGVNIEGNTVINGNVTLPNPNEPLTIFNPSYFQNGLNSTGQFNFTGKIEGVSTPVSNFNISAFVSGHISARDNIDIVSSHVSVPTVDSNYIQRWGVNGNSYIDSDNPGDAINKRALYNYHRRFVDTVFSDLKISIDEKDTAVKADANSKIKALKEEMHSMYGTLNQANIQRLYNDERPTNPIEGQIYCLVTTKDYSGLDFDYEEYYQYSEKAGWVLLDNASLVDLTSEQTITGKKKFAENIVADKLSSGRYYTLGESNNPWDKVYATYLNVPWSGSNFGPQSSDSYNLGDISHLWKNIFVKGVLHDGSNSISIANIASKGEIPTKLSQFENDNNFTSKSYVDNLVSSIPKFEHKVVSELPTENIRTDTIYLVTTDSDYPYMYQEYIYVDGDWELLGGQTLDIEVPTKVSQLENDAGYISKSIIPNEINSKFAVSSSLNDLTANTIRSRTDIGASFIVRSIAYGNDTYVAVGNNANMRYLYKNSPTWGECDISYHSTSSTFTSITYGKAMFVCVEYYEENEEKNSILHKSLNGIEWEQVHHFNFGIENIIYANGRFILVGSQGYIAFTDDLITFTPTNSKIENDIISVTYGKNRYVAVSNKGDIIYSLDSVVWNVRSIPDDTTHYRVATYGKGMFVIGGRNGTIRYSYDGISWNTAIVNSNLNSINYIRAICYYNGKFFACLYGSGVSGTDGEILTSVDGINWTSDLVDETNRLWAIGFGNDVVLIGGDNGAIHKYNLNIEWLDYEPELKSGEVLWQKQFLTLSDGSTVEGEVEVHTNMKNIYEQVLYGGIGAEYELKEGLDLYNKTFIFNKEFDVSELPFDTINGGYVPLVTPSSSGIGIYLNYYDGSYNIYAMQVYGSPAYPVETLMQNGMWITTEYTWIDFNSTVGSFISNYTDYFKIVDKTKSLKDIINESYEKSTTAISQVSEMRETKLDGANIYIPTSVIKEILNDFIYKDYDGRIYNIYHGNIHFIINYYNYNDYSNGSNYRYASVMSGNQGFSTWNYNGIEWVEIFNSSNIPTKEELVQLVIEALPKYNGEVIE